MPTPVKPATINRELEVLRQAMRLARRDGRLAAVPSFPMLHMDNARQGFVTDEQIDDVAGRLPDHLAPVVRFLAEMGWRKQEALGLTWPSVDLQAGDVRLDAASTKTRQARTFPFTRELKRILDAQWAAHLKMKKADRIVPHVFHHDGQPIGSFSKAWATATRAAGVPGRVVQPHGSRLLSSRTALTQPPRATPLRRTAALEHSKDEVPLATP